MFQSVLQVTCKKQINRFFVYFAETWIYTLFGVCADTFFIMNGNYCFAVTVFQLSYQIQFHFYHMIEISVMCFLNT
jgi:hypothetical protein